MTPATRPIASSFDNASVRAHLDLDLLAHLLAVQGLEGQTTSAARLLPLRQLPVFVHVGQMAVPTTAMTAPPGLLTAPALGPCFALGQ